MVRKDFDIAGPAIYGHRKKEWLLVLSAMADRITGRFLSL